MNIIGVGSKENKKEKKKRCEEEDQEKYIRTIFVSEEEM